MGKKLFLAQLCAMAKEKEKRQAKSLYIYENKTQRQIADLLDVSLTSVNHWVAKGKWKELKDAQATKPEQLEQDLKDLIGDLVEKRAEMERDPNADQEKKYKISDEISKLNKTLQSVKQDQEVPLNLYIRVMEKIFAAIQRDEPQLYNKLLDFQEKHLEEVAQSLY